MIEGCRAERSTHGRGVARVLGWPLVGGAMALAVWFARTMRGADTTLRTDKPASSLVQDGPFRYSRNPGYLSLTMLYVGISILRNALWAILLLPLVLYVIQREVIECEERYLERTFGEEYLAYKRRVRRWV
jgi:protein-S-isoprenylcysteine O-methyltransferase Ste14